jgi:hypothetical protein
MLYSLLMGKFATLRKVRGNRRQKGIGEQRRLGIARLRVEPLEDRRMLSMSPWFGALFHGFNSFAFRGPADTTPTLPANTVTLQNRPSTSFYGQSVQLTAKVTSATSGTVEFFDGTTLLDATPINVSSRGVANYVTSTLAVGTHSITAEYFAADNTTTTPTSTSTAVPETVNAAPTRIIVSASTNPQLAGSDVTFTATVSSGNWCMATSAQTGAPGGTVKFTVANVTGSTSITSDPMTLDSTGAAKFTPSPALAAGTYNVTVTFTPADGNYTASSSGVFVEQIAAPTAVGTGTVTAGTATSPISLRGGQQLSIDVTQTLDTNTNALADTGGGVTYVDSAHGINLTSTAITSVIFDSKGYVAQIIGAGNNVTTDSTGTKTTTPVTFTLLVNAGSGDWFSRPGINISIFGTPTPYQQSSTVSQGSISVTGTGSTTSVPARGGLWHDRALQSVMGDWNGPGPGFRGGRHWW